MLLASPEYERVPCTYEAHIKRDMNTCDVCMPSATTKTNQVFHVVQHRSTWCDASSGA